MSHNLCIPELHEEPYKTAAQAIQLNDQGPLEAMGAEGTASGVRRQALYDLE